MQFKTLTILALSAMASALRERQIPTPTDAADASIVSSVLSVLETALPQSLLLLGATNAPALSADIASSLSAGNIPSWYLALPSDVQSNLPLLFPADATTAVSGSGSASSSSLPATLTNSASASYVSSILSVQSSISASISQSLNTTTISSVSSATLKSSSTKGASASGASGSATSASSSGGAAYPTAVVGAGVAGAIGFLGMLAL